MTYKYRRLTDADSQRILDGKCNEMLLLSQIAEDFDWKFGALSEYLGHLITPPGKAHNVPVFYGIPKIHKQPVKFRPILPCHSAIQNPAAKFCSKMLKPIVDAAPTVIKGTKDLAIKLSSLEIPRWRKKWLVTGDVVAFYPNIPLRKCLDRTFEMYMEHYWNVADHDEGLNRKEQSLFRRCLEVGNTNLVTQFQDVKYEQLNGLAMGVADSPDLANLYGWFCERRDQVQQHPDIAFYGRYIDDCFAIVYAETESDALELCRDLIKIDDCQITWETGRFLPFLDLTIYVDSDGSVQHMPYRKARSHQERVPWISAHPFDVKRGTFLGEMSRLATLSSKIEHYSDAMKGLAALYVKRGYPTDLVQSWLKENYSKRWESRLRVEKEDSPDVLVLKTHFNTAWNYFHARELGETITGYMRTWLYKAERSLFDKEYPPVPRGYLDSLAAVNGVLHTVDDAGTPIDVPDIRDIGMLDRKMIVSRKRTKNLYDYAASWKKIVLEKLDEREVSGEAILPDGVDTIPPAEPPLPVDPDRFYRHPSGRLVDMQDDEVGPRRRSPSPAYGWMH